MKLTHVLLLLMMVACSKAETASDTQAIADTAPPPAPVRTGPPPLDSLVMQLDSAGGFYWPKTRRQLELTNATLPAYEFRTYGREGVQALIDCLADTTTTKTYHADDMNFKFPRGVLCYEVLQLVMDIDRSRQLGINDQDLFVSLEKGQIRPELNRAKRAYQVIFNARAFRLRSIAPPG